MKTHRNVRRNPRSRVTECLLKVAIVELLTACRLRPSCRCLRLARGGITLTSAPVLTRKRSPVGRSVTKNRRLGCRPVALVAASDWPDRFPTSNKVPYISGLRHHIVGDTNTGWSQLEGVVEMGWVNGSAWTFPAPRGTSPAP